MQKIHTDVVRHSHLSKRELFGHYHDVTAAVIAKYVEIKSLHPMVCSSIDREAAKPSTRLSFALIEYAADIEKTTTQALGDRLDLQSCWFSIALHEPVKPALQAEVIWRCGRLYAARQLQPWAYWKKTR